MNTIAATVALMAMRAPSAPSSSTNVVVSGNAITFAGEATIFHRGIGIRNSQDYIIASNIIRRPHRGIELYGMTADRTSLSSGIVASNIVSDCGESILFLRGSVADVTITGNRGDTKGDAVIRLETSMAGEPTLFGNRFSERGTALSI